MAADHPDDTVQYERERLFAFDVRADDHYFAPAIPNGMLRLYGGHVVAQALAAAQRTVDPARLVSSCHAFFVRPGDIDTPVDLHVLRDRDGQSFSFRRVEAIQSGKLILSLSAAFQVPEQGLDWQSTMPETPPPDQFVAMEELLDAMGNRLPARHRPFWRRRHLFEWRPVEPWQMVDAEPAPVQHRFWMRCRARLGDDPAEHQRFFAYASDLHIIHGALRALGLPWTNDYLQPASIDHAVWFHRPFRADEWMLLVVDSDIIAGSRTLGRGTIFTPDGQLVASVAQDGLVRMLDAPRAGL